MPSAGLGYVVDENSVDGMAALGVHVLDNFHYRAGPIAELYVRSRRLLGRSEVDDATVIVMELEGGLLAYLGTSLVVPNTMTTVAIGTDAIAWSEEDNQRFFVQEKGESGRREIPLDPIDVLGAEMVEFAQCIRRETSPVCGGEGSIEMAAVLDAVRQRAATHEPVAVAPFRPAGFPPPP